MWNDKDDTDSLRPPAVPQAAAKARVAFRSHEPVETMGQDDYIRYPAAAPSEQDDDDDRSSQRTTSTAHLTGAATTRESRDEVGGLRSRNNAQPSAGPTNDGSPAPGMPIGFLAALGTPYAKKPIYRSRKCRILCPIIGGFTVAVTIIITLFPVLRAVAVHTLNTAVMQIATSNITLASNTSFTLTLEGQVKKVGIFPAQLHFAKPVVVYWIAPENLTEELALGQFALAPIGVAAGHGRIKQKTLFNITNEPAFARFTEFLITQEAFTWRLKSTEVQAKAFSFIAVNDLVFTKDLTLPGMANMTDVSISDFQLPGDDPAGGISLAVTTKLTNPSAFGVEMGTLEVDLFYKDLYLGPARTAAPINLTSGINTINLVGRMVPYLDNATALAELSTVFSNYLNGFTTMVTARGRSVTLPNGETISWLSKGVKALVLSVPLKSTTGRISPITSITIKQLSLGFDSANPYAPTTNSSFIDATFGLPFGFSLDIAQLSNAFTIVSNKTAVTSLSAPLALAETTLLTRDAGFTTGSLKLNLPLSRLVTPPSYTDHLIFEQFNYDFTTTTGANFFLVGNTSVITNTPVGQVLLTNIGFTVPAGLIGLNGLKTFPTTIISVDVIGGTPEAVVLAIRVGLTNPSNLDLTLGNVTFQLYNGKSFLGTTVLPDLHLVPGYQEQDSIGYLLGNDNAGALATLTGYAQGVDADLMIRGFNGSSQTKSLTQAFMGIELSTTLKGLQTKLINSANLTVLPSTGINNNFANSIVSLANPFTSPLMITNIQSNITSHGLFVGSIVQDTQFMATGKSSSISPILDFNLNLFPPDIFGLLRALVVDAGMDPAPLDGVVALGGLQYSRTTSNAKRSLQETLSDEEQGFADQLVAPAKVAMLPGQEQFAHMFSPIEEERRSTDDFESLLFAGEAADSAFNATDSAPALVKRDGSRLAKRGLYTNFDLPSYVMQAFAGLKVDIDLLSVLTIGEFTTNLAYTQRGVAANTDSSLTLLLPVLARPIVQKIVDASILGVATVMITDPTNESFNTGLVGSITNAGPFDAVIGFPSGLTVAWNGKPLGQIAMPNVPLAADVGASLDINAPFRVLDLAHLTDFTGYLLNEPSFTWQIYGTNLSVAALGITVGGISISKNVVLDGMNGFRGLVVVEGFDLPANDPAGGISLSLATSLTNPSSVGVQLSQIGFQNFFGATNIGPAGSLAPFALSPKTTINLALGGRLIPQSTPSGLNDVSTIFNGFIHGVPSNLIVQGAYAGPAECTWLNDGIKTLSIGVILPAAVNLEVINSITINQLSLFFTEANPYAPSFSTSNTVAKFQLPFAFPVDITAAKTSITAGDVPAGDVRRRGSGDFAQLNVPLLPAKTDVVARTLLLTFADIPFTSVNDGIFSSFLLDTTQSISKTFGLHGLADTKTSTAVGELSLTDVAFDVNTNVLGLQGLNARPAVVSELDVFRGFPDFLQINVKALLFNPSNITIGTGNVRFALQFQDQIIGGALIDGLVLVPGDNNIPTAVRYAPTGGASTAAGQILLQNFVQGITSNTIILGTRDTTPIRSLQAALGSIALQASIPPIMQNLIVQASLSFPLDIAETEIADATFQLANPFTASINLVSVLANATYQGIFLGQIRVQNLNPPIRAPGKTLITSPVLPLALNADPQTLARFLIAAAAAQGVGLGPLVEQFTYLLSLSSPLAVSKITTRVNLEPETCTPTGTTASTNAIILAAVANLRSNLSIQSLTRLDEYQTALDFSQFNVPTVLDRSVLYLTGILGKPLVTRIVDESQLAFSSGLVTGVTDNGFTAALKGSLLNVGPFDALIEFPDGVTVIWQGSEIATIALPPICSSGGSGVPNLETTGVLTIKNLARFTDFATFILLNPGFEWTITSNTVRVSALGTIFSNVALTKKISFTAFNGLPGVTIVNPDFPGDEGTSIRLVTDTLIPSQSNLGIELGRVSFLASFQGQTVGPIEGSGLTLAPLAVTAAKLTGSIIRRTSQASTDSLGVLFSNFLAGQNQTLQVQGVQVVTPAQPDRPVNWLSTAFKQLTLNVVLPGKRFEIIQSIALRDLTVFVENQDQAFAPLVTNNRTEVVYKNPFGFSLTSIEAGGAFTIEYQGTSAGLLTLPQARAVSAETSTGQNANLVLNFLRPTPLVSLNNPAFQRFFSAVTNTPLVNFRLFGSANVLARTVVGDIQINGIPFSVQTSFVGINAFNRVATIPETPRVIGSGSGDHFRPSPGGSEYIRITLNVILSNPAPLILHTNMVSFQVIYRNYVVGRAYINPLDLQLGTNTIPSEFHYEPADPSSPIAQDLLSQYLMTKGNIPLTVQGDFGSSPYGSLQLALSETTLASGFPGQGLPLINDILIYFDPIVAICGGFVAITTRINNNLGTKLQVVSLAGTASQDGVQYASFDYTFKNPFVAAAGANPSAYSEMVTPVFLTQKAAGSLVLALNEGKGLEISIVSRAIIDGYTAPSFRYTQRAVPYKISYTLAGATLSGLSPGQVPSLSGLSANNLGSVIGTLNALTTCDGNDLVANGNALGLGDLPSALRNLIKPSTLAPVISIVAPVISSLAPVVSSVVSIASLAPVVTPIASVVSAIPVVAPLLGPLLAPPAATAAPARVSTTPTN